MNPHREVLDRACAVYEARNADYQDVWKEYGWRGCLVHLRTCVVRSFRVLWDVEPDDIANLRRIDNLIDTINYAAFAIRAIEEGNRDGDWWGK